MATDSIGASAAVTNSQLNIQDFIRIFTAQLSYQDPMKPMDNTEFLSQMAQFTGLEQSRLTNEKLDALISTLSLSQSVGLIGRTVDVLIGASTVSGQVTQLSFVDGQPRFAVRQSSGAVIPDLPLSQILAVR